MIRDKTTETILYTSIPAFSFHVPESMDEQLLFQINREWTHPVLDRVMTIMSSAALWMTPLILLGVVALVWGGWRQRCFIIIALLAIGIADGIVGRTLKQTVNRPRPHQTETNVRQIELARPLWKGIFLPVKEKFSLGGESQAGGRSFPSNHTLNTMAIAMLAAIAFPRAGWLAFFPALIVAYSRIFTGSHWPSDILASIFMGAGIGLWVLLLSEWIWRKWGRIYCPATFDKHPHLIVPFQTAPVTVNRS